MNDQPANYRNTLQINQSDLVMVAVMGQVAHPVAAGNPYRIGHDGVPRVLPATGGIVLNQRVGDRCVGLMGDHIEPGVALHNNNREVIGARNGPNLALITYACVGNIARVISGPCNGKRGLVTGKHGGVDHVLVDFPPTVLQRLQIGDRIQINSYGLGLKILGCPEINVTNCSPSLLQRWGIRENDRRLQVPCYASYSRQNYGFRIGEEFCLARRLRYSIVRPPCPCSLSLRNITLWRFCCHL
jgi:hypothetical protein